MARKSPLGETRVGGTLERQPQSEHQGESPACLVFIAGDKIGRKLEVRGGELVLGRDPSCTVPLPSDLISRRHAEITVDGDRVMLKDLGSTNGTYVNDRPVEELELRDGDRISVGEVVLKFLAKGNAEAAYHDEVYRLMSFDGLTEVLNKRVFHEHLSAATEDASKPLSLLVFDADHFKRVNDTHGHAAGDLVLRQLARTAEGQLVADCDLGRVGGEEFAILTRLNSDEAMSLAEGLRAAVENHYFEWEGERIPVTVSVGLACRARDSQESAKELFARADAELYRAKASGRNCVCA